jgi:hypothetical protein
MNYSAHLNFWKKLLMRLALITLPSVLLLLIACTAGNTHKLSELRYDGIYKSRGLIDGEKYCDYVQFYQDGTVIMVTSVYPKSALKDIKNWFDTDGAGPEFAGLSECTIHVNSNQIKFDVISKESKISYDGTFSNKRMSLSYYSHINNEDFKFMRW